MTSLELWLEALIAVAVLLNLAATLETLLSPFLEGSQRARWLALIWLLPIIGAVISLASSWRNYRGLDRSPDPEALGEAADLAGVPGVTPTRRKSSSDWGDAGDD